MSAERNVLEKRKASTENLDIEPKRMKNGDDKPLCKYGASCYQKNPYHLSKFSHPAKVKVDNSTVSEVECLNGKGEEIRVCKISDDGDDKIKKVSTCLQAEDSLDHKQLPEVLNLKDDERLACTTPDDDKVEKSSTLEADSAHEQMPPSPLDVKENIRQKFLFDMPQDFYSFWDFCKQLRPENPCNALQETLGLKLVGPFQLLSPGFRPQCRRLEFFLTEWRYYYDPPEFQTLLAGDVSTGFHVGYFRDDPKELPVFVACNTESEGCLMTPMADNLFSAVSWLVSEKSKGADPFKTSKMTALRNSLNSWASSKGILIQGLDKERKKRVVAKTFYGCGIVVPYNRKTKLGYREIPETDAKLKKILHKIVESKNDTERDKNFDPLQQLVTNVQYANDELDWGMGLELGLDLLAFGGQVLHTTIIHLLGVAYELLERPEFTTILKAHLNNRRKLSGNPVAGPSLF